MDKSNEHEPKSSRLIELAFILSQQNDLDEIFRIVAQKTARLLLAHQKSTLQKSYKISAHTHIKNN